MVAEEVRTPETGSRLQRVVGSALRTLLGAVLVGLVLLNVANAVARATGVVVIGVDEVLVFGMIWMVMLGMLLVTAEKGHIALELLNARVGPRTVILLSVVTHLVMAWACAYAALQSFYFVQRVAALGQTSMALGMPMLIPHSALIVGFGGTAIVALALVWHDVKLLAARRENRAMIWTLGALPLTLLIIGTPIFALLLAGAIVTFLCFLTVPSIALHQVMFGGLENYALLAIPFFIFAGELMGAAGIADRLIVWVLALIGRVPGSLGVATVGASTLIGAISGASVATVAAVGKSLYPGLIRDGYGARFSSGLVASSGAIDILIPPSIAMILYGAAAEQSIPKLFVAGVLPGLLIALMMAAYVVVRALQMKIPTSGHFDLCHFARTSYGAAPALFMPAFVLGIIYFGYSSPTEAGGFACLYAILVGRYIYRTMSWRDVFDAAARSAMLTAQILVIVATAALFSWILTISGFPQSLAAWLQSLQLTPWAFLMATNIILLVVGCFLDPTSAILVLTPLFIPLVKQVGIDPIHFGIVMTANIAIGMFTPPFGLNMFVARSVLGVPLETIYRGVLPFVVVQIVALLIITYWPELSLFLTRAI